MAFIFTMRSASTNPRNIPDVLPAISEDGDVFSDKYVAPRKITTGVPQHYSPSGSDTYNSHSTFSDASSGAKENEKIKPGLRDNEQIAKRGGWKRLAIIAVVVTLCLVGLIVGLVVGLRKRNNTTPWSSTTNWGLNSTFPGGNYTIQTYLSTVSSNCTSNAATWRCWPYSTYSESPSGALTTLDWTIYAFTSSSQEAPTYTVSSSPNPFAFFFSNITLTLLDLGLSTERFYFNVSIPKVVIPGMALTASNAVTSCYFNQTMLEANLYLTMGKTYPTDNTTAAANQLWPYAAEFKQFDESGSTTPQCYDTSGNLVGTYAVATAGEECACDYMNYGT